TTGAAEDERIYMDLAAFSAWTGVTPTAVELSVPGTRSDVEAAIVRLRTALPEADVQPVRQIVEGETRVLGKTRAALFASTALVIVTAALCVLATLMSWVVDRRRDFAVMKALGASERLLRAFFAAEAGLIGALGATLGFVFGVALAVWLGRVNFHAAVAPHFSAAPPVIAGGIAIALVAALAPISFLRGI